MEVPGGANSRPPCASTGPVPRYEFREERRGGGGGSGLISFAAYSWNRILGLPGLGVVQSVCRNKGPLGAPKSMAQESDLLGFN